MSRDRFGNEFAPDVPYARGSILASTADDLAKLRTAQAIIRERREALGADSIYLLSGLERRLDAEPEDIALMDDELAGAVFGERLRQRGLEHLGGDPGRDDVLLLNRLTAGLLVAADVLIQPRDRVVGVSPTYSHPAVVRAVAHAGAELEDVAGLRAFERAAAASERLDVVFVTRLAVSYEILDEADLLRVIALARERGATIIVDDAGGARVGPAIFGQPRTLALGVDVGVTGLDKYGTSGPRVGLLGGRSDLVERIRVRAYEMGLEARQMLYQGVIRSLESYRAERVRELVACTKEVAQALRGRLSANRLLETPVTVQLRAEDILEIAMERAGIDSAPIVPYEATAALAMLLLRDFGVVTVQFAGIPPGTSALMIKFVPPETLRRFGGADALAEAIDHSLSRLGEHLRDSDEVRELLKCAPGGATDIESRP